MPPLVDFIVINWRNLDFLKIKALTTVASGS